MAAEGKSFFRWYWTSVLGILLYITTFAVFWGWILTSTHDKGLFAILTNPFFILAWIILILSHVDQDYMWYRLEKRDGVDVLSSKDPPSYYDQTIADRYRTAFGTDIFVRFWKVRFAFVGCFAISAIWWLAASTFESMTHRIR
jgi:hypothetical protein